MALFNDDYILFFSTITIFLSKHVALRYAYTYSPYLIISFTSLLTFTLKGKIDFKISMATIPLITLISLGLEYFDLRKSEHIVPRWETKKLYQESFSEENAVFVTDHIESEYFRKYIYHQNFKKISIMDDLFCFDALGNLKETTFVVDIYKPAPVKTEVLNFLLQNNFKKVFETNNLHFYIITQ